MAKLSVRLGLPGSLIIPLKRKVNFGKPLTVLILKKIQEFNFFSLISNVDPELPGFVLGNTKRYTAYSGVIASYNFARVNKASP